MPFSTAIATVEYIYWCPDCEMRVTLFSPPLSSNQTLLCPHCLTTFLEHILPPTPTSINVTFSSPATSHSLPNLSLSTLRNSQSSSPTVSIEEANPGGSAIAGSRSSKPASSASVEAIPTIKISSSLLEFDPILLCAICMDQLEVDVKAKQLPCKHVYHGDCILLWLSKHNSCPVCRFELPVDDASEMPSEEDDLFGFGSTLRHINRSNR